MDLATEVLGILSDPTRIKIVLTLRQSDELPVNALAEIVGKRPSGVSQHLARLRMARMVTTRQEGTSVLYRLTDEYALTLVIEAWQIYILIFLLQSASATFTPTFQAVIPSVLPDENDYTRALSLSRLAYDLESLVSPMLAAALLTVISFHNLFVGTVIGFFASAALVIASCFPHIDAPLPARFFDRLTHGARAFWASSELRGLMSLNLVVATTTAIVIVNTVVLVQGDLGRTQADVALLLAAYGGGSILVALGMPKPLETLPDQRVMLTGGIALPILLLAVTAVIAWMSDAPQWIAFLVVWALLGAATSAILTPSARLLRRDSAEQNRPAVFAAQFSLSHACFLITYPSPESLAQPSDSPQSRSCSSPSACSALFSPF